MRFSVPDAMTIDETEHFLRHLEGSFQPSDALARG